MKFKDYAERWMTSSGINRSKELQLVDMEEKADSVSIGRASPCCNERPNSAQMEEDTKRLIALLRSPLDELIREVKKEPELIQYVDTKGCTLLHYAAQEGATEAIEFLVDNGAGIDALDWEDNTPMHYAICWNQADALKSLLIAEADTTILNKAKMAPLHLACDQNKPHMIQILATGSNFDVNLLGELGQTPLHFCGVKNCLDAAKKLLEFKPRFCIADKAGVFPAHAAACHAAKEVLNLLLTESEKCGYSRAVLFSFKDNENNTPLHSAVNGGSEDAVRVCLEEGAPPDVQQDDDSTPLHLACSQGALGIVKLLLNADKCLRTLCMRDISNMTPLHKAAMFDHLQVVELLLLKGADIDAMDSNLRTPLLLASSRGAWRTVSYLIKRGASHALKDDKNRNIMHLIVQSGGNINILGVDLTQKGDMNSLINDTDHRGCTPMHYATRDGNIKSVQGLLEWGATVKLKNKDKQSPLHFAAKYGRFNSCKRLLDSHIGPNIINDTDGRGMTALHIAAWNGQTKLIQLLMLRGALLHRDHDGRTPLHLASMAGYVETMKVLLGTHGHLLDQVDAKGDASLHVAAREGQVGAVRYLLTAGACLFLNRDKESIFDIVIEEKNHDVAMAMVVHDRWHETLNSYGGDRFECPVAKLIEHMPEVMTKVLDKSITMANSDPASAEFWVNYDFRYLEPPIDTRIECQQQGIDVPALPALNHMVRNNKVELLSHPLCIEYLNNKWTSYGAAIHNCYFILYMLFVAVFTYFIATMDPTPIMTPEGIIHYKNLTGSSNLQEVSHSQYACVVFILAYVGLNVIKEFYQMFSQRLWYFLDVENYAEWTVYSCTLIFMLPFVLDCSSHYQWGAGAIAIFCAWLNLLMYQQRIDTIGIYVVMFYEILHTILRVMAVFSVIIIAFGLAFYILMSGEVNFAFSSPEISIFRVFSMMLGELDFINSFVAPVTDGDPATLHYIYLSYFFLVMVVILLPILLMNLLIGLAVGDIAAVQRDAQLKRLAMQVDLHTDYEPKIPTKILKWVWKDQITIRPNSVCPRSAGFSFLNKIKAKLIVKDGGNKRFASLKKPDREGPCNELEKMKKKLKNLSGQMDKQYQMLRLIVQKMEIHTEADEQDEGDAPTNDEGAVRMRMNMSSVVTAAAAAFAGNRLGLHPTVNVAPASRASSPASYTSDVISISDIAEPSM